MGAHWGVASMGGRMDGANILGEKYGDRFGIMPIILKILRPFQNPPPLPKSSAPSKILRPSTKNKNLNSKIKNSKLNFKYLYIL
jgi:hypothetical protein